MSDLLASTCSFGPAAAAEFTVPAPSQHCSLAPLAFPMLTEEEENYENDEDAKAQDKVGGASVVSKTAIPEELGGHSKSQLVPSLCSFQ